jgi:hypothetical protein
MSEGLLHGWSPPEEDQLNPAAQPRVNHRTPSVMDILTQPDAPPPPTLRSLNTDNSLVTKN